MGTTVVTFDTYCPVSDSEGPENTFSYGGLITDYHLPVEPNTTYTVSCYLRTNVITASGLQVISGQLNVREYDASGDQIVQNHHPNPTIPAANQWFRMERTITTDPETVSVRIQVGTTLVFTDAHYVENDDPFVTGSIVGPQFELGDHATAFVPEPSVALLLLPSAALLLRRARKRPSR